MAPKPKAEKQLDDAERLLDEDQYSKAYDTAKKALESGGNKERSLFILGDAAYGMRKWERSVGGGHYEELCKAFPSNRQAKDGLRGAQIRLTESRTGRYDLAKLYEVAVKGKKNINVADYVGPIEVADIPGKGKGIVATQDVKKGTLLMLSKAFAVVDSMLPEKSSIRFGTNVSALQRFGTNVSALLRFGTVPKRWAPPEKALSQAVAQKLERCPELADEVSALYDGSERNLDEPKTLTPTRIYEICKHNKFGTEGLDDLPRRFDTHKQMRGLWILPSYFNHSCLRNAHYIFYGDIMTVFAVSDVKKGEEIVINYVGPLDPFEMRSTRLTLERGFVCKCRLCELDRMDPLYEKREVMVESCLQLSDLAAVDPVRAVVMLKGLLSLIRETYTVRQELMTQLYSPLKSLGNVLQGVLGEYDMAVEYFLETAECLDESILSLVGVRLYVQIVDCYTKSGQFALARKYARMAADLHRVRSGQDDAVYQKIFADRTSF